MLDLAFFRGARPKLEAHLLEKGEAQKAVNCRLQTGALQAYRGQTVVQAISLPSVKSIHKYGDTANWFEFQNDANAVEGPLADDTESTTYFTSDSEPAMTYASIATSGAAPYPTNRYRLGIPAPTNTMTLGKTGTPDPDDENPDSRVYLVTYVSARGEEGSPSLNTGIVDVYEGESVVLSNIPTAPAGNYNISTKRIYRTSSASGDTSYLFVAEIPVAQDSYTDSIASENLGEVLPSLEWYQPPDDMQGLTGLANGVMAGFAGKELYLCEPNLPHAWPYQITMDNPIVGLVGVTGGVIVATTGQPVIVAFTHPASAAQIEIQSARACVSKRSMVDMGEYALFATGDGLVAVDGAGNAPLISGNVIDRYQWQEFNPSTIHAYRRENWYIAFYEGQNGSGGFAITVQGDDYFELDFYADAGFTDPKTGDLYLVVNDNIVKWDDDELSLISYEWQSGEILLPKPLNMSVARVDAESYPVTFKLYSEDTLLHTQTVASEQPFWLPANFLVRKYSVALEGTATVRRVLVADSIEALA